MTRTLRPGGVRLAVSTAPDHSGVDYYIETPYVEEIKASERAGEPADTGTIVVDNSSGRFTLKHDHDPPGIDDKITVLTQPTGYARGHGVGPMGAGPMGDYKRVGTYLVVDQEISSTGPTESSITLDVEDYVYGILGNRQVYAYAEDNQLVAGHADAHLNQIIEGFAPQIKVGGVPELHPQTEYAAHAKSLKTVVEELAGMVANEYGAAVHYGRGNRLYLNELGTTDPVTDTALTRRDFQGEFSSSVEARQLVNQLRVDGGRDEDNVADAQETVDHFEHASDTSRITVRLDTPKPELPQIEVYTNGDGESPDGLRVRLQRDDGTDSGPIAPANTEYDLISSSARKVALSLDGWTTFKLGDHDAFERAPWLIVDSPGAEGYDVGVDANGVPAFRAYFSKPIVASIPDGQSLQQYLRHDGHIRDEAIRTTRAARDRARSTLARHGLPERRFAPGSAASQRAHDLRAGDVAPLDFPLHQIDGDHVVASRTVKYQSDNRIQTELEFAGL